MENDDSSDTSAVREAAMLQAMELVKKKYPVLFTAEGSDEAARALVEDIMADTNVMVTDMLQRRVMSGLATVFNIDLDSLDEEGFMPPEVKAAFAEEPQANLKGYLEEAYDVALGAVEQMFAGVEVEALAQLDDEDCDCEYHQVAKSSKDGVLPGFVFPPKIGKA